MRRICTIVLLLLSICCLGQQVHRPNRSRPLSFVSQVYRPGNSQTSSTGTGSVGCNNVPSVLLELANPVTDTWAQIMTVVNPNGHLTGVKVQYGLTTSFGTIVALDGSPIDGCLTKALEVILSDLDPGTTYYYQVVATNARGSSIHVGGISSFTTFSFR